MKGGPEMRVAAALLSVVLCACGSSHTGDEDGGGDGVCCPVTDFEGCSPGESMPGGGWAASLDQCTYTIGGFDGRPWTRTTDARGCPRVEEASSGCCGCVTPDAGPPDAGTDPCDGLGPAACFAEFACAPIFDNACCPSCTPGPCADCENPVYAGCGPFEACRGACGDSPSWACFPTEPSCSGARPLGDESCDQPGCVPASAPIGEPSPMGLCRPITGDSCTVACRQMAPLCPEGTVPEGDGECYTGWCLPAFVCE
ncbi:MAG: hypothetical protein AB8I08_19865 [Sandaracinaceae bacterium]